MVRKKVSIRGFLLFLNEKFILSIEHKSAEERSVNQYCNVRIYFNLQQRRMKIMKRIIDELFVTEENRGYSLDDIIAIRNVTGDVEIEDVAISKIETSFGSMYDTGFFDVLMHSGIYTTVVTAKDNHYIDCKRGTPANKWVIPW